MSHTQITKCHQFLPFNHTTNNNMSFTKMPSPAWPKAIHFYLSITQQIPVIKCHSSGSQAHNGWEGPKGPVPFVKVLALFYFGIQITFDDDICLKKSVSLKYCFVRKAALLGSMFSVQTSVGYSLPITITFTTAAASAIRSTPAGPRIVAQGGPLCSKHKMPKGNIV